MSDLKQVAEAVCPHLMRFEDHDNQWPSSIMDCRILPKWTGTNDLPECRYRKDQADCPVRRMYDSMSALAAGDAPEPPKGGDDDIIEATCARCGAAGTYYRWNLSSKDPPTIGGCWKCPTEGSAADAQATIDRVDALRAEREGECALAEALDRIVNDLDAGKFLPGLARVLRMKAAEVRALAADLARVKAERHEAVKRAEAAEKRIADLEARLGTSTQHGLSESVDAGLLAGRVERYKQQLATIRAKSGRQRRELRRLNQRLQTFQAILRENFEVKASAAETECENEHLRRDAEAAEAKIADLEQERSAMVDACADATTPVWVKQDRWFRASGYRVGEDWYSYDERIAELEEQVASIEAAEPSEPARVPAPAELVEWFGTFIDGLLFISTTTKDRLRTIHSILDPVDATLVTREQWDAAASMASQYACWYVFRHSSDEAAEVRAALGIPEEWVQKGESDE